MNKLYIKYIIAVVLILPFVIGCEQDTPTDKLEVTPKVITSTNEVIPPDYTITSKGTFKAGYDNTVREIFILKDNKTGEEFLGVTDATLIRRISQKKQEAAEEAMDAALDILGD